MTINTELIINDIGFGRWQILYALAPWLGKYFFNRSYLYEGTKQKYMKLLYIIINYFDYIYSSLK